MDQVIPKYIPANSIEDRFGFLVTALDSAGKRQYLSRGGFQWGPIGDAEFFDDPLNAADSIKAMTEQASGGESAVAVDSIKLVRVSGIMVPTVISAADLKRRRRDAALKKLTAEEIDALGLAEADFEEQDRKARHA
ncbi:MAG TPA: hypothetical protein VMB81_07845 [Candidatus Sulfotelmatobacter sp.]|nr:hypothetical protein [Candidatus Sulfotelmatobacter sp.]